METPAKLLRYIVYCSFDYHVKDIQLLSNMKYEL
jgi:hypothetical protein